MPLVHLHNQDQQICAQCNLGSPMILIVGNETDFPVLEAFPSGMDGAKTRVPMLTVGPFNEVAEQDRFGLFSYLA